jgi:hypothetical protein
LERTKQLQQLSRGSTTIFKELCCRVSLVPFQSMIYAISYVRLSTKAKRGSSASVYRRKLLANLHTLKALAKLLQSSIEVDSTLSYMNTRSAVNNYVSFFYSMSDKERSSYLCVASSHVLHGIAPEKNLLLVPAMMAGAGKPKRAVVSNIEIALYKKSFQLLYDASTSALQIMRFRQQTAIERFPEAAIAEFTRSLAKLDSRIQSIEHGKINPESDESLKQSFIRSAMIFSESSYANALDALSEKLETQSVKYARIHKLIRKAQH